MLRVYKASSTYDCIDNKTNNRKTLALRIKVIGLFVITQDTSNINCEPIRNLLMRNGGRIATAFIRSLFLTHSIFLHG